VTVSKPRTRLYVLSLAVSISLALGATARGEETSVVYQGGNGPGAGKHVVFVSGDEEYRSEEALPQLAKILAKRHGFKCTVLFAINKDGEIDPTTRDHIPGLEALDSADLMIIATRFRDLPDDQMKHLVDYIESGRPIIGLRTATHAFNIRVESVYLKYAWDQKEGDWAGGFGRRVLGETWVAHHGEHSKQSTRGVIVADAKDHPIVRGIKDGQIWGPSDVYAVRLPLPGDSRPLVLGQVVEGMTPLSPAAFNKQMMPIAWTKTYTGTAGKPARVFTTTMGAATDLENEAFRRLLVNAAYWAVGLEDKIMPGTDAALVGEFHPRPFGFGRYATGVKPESLKD
jgi:type 1 glutamine amidotransferase